jgi:hypothetical protein
MDKLTQRSKRIMRIIADHVTLVTPDAVAGGLTVSTGGDTASERRHPLDTPPASPLAYQEMGKKGVNSENSWQPLGEIAAKLVERLS